MYSASNLFRKAYAYCCKKYNALAILSAKYGLLLPEEEIEPYNLTLNKVTADNVKEWSEEVFVQMTKKLNLQDFDIIFFHAGKRYRKYLISKLEKIGVKCEVPLRNLSIGRQLAWYNMHLSRMENTC